MKKIIFGFFMIISFVGCENKEKGKAMLVFNDIKQFPQEIIITQWSKNFLLQADTFQIKEKKDVRIPIEIDRPKYVYVQKGGEIPSFFLRPGSRLKVSKDNGHYVFEGDMKQENAFLEEIRNNRELRKKVWQYSVPFTEFKQQVADYFEYKEQLLDKYLPEKKDGQFRHLIAIDDSASENDAILEFVKTRLPKPKRDSLYR